jgi:hypothetical protein
MFPFLVAHGMGKSGVGCGNTTVYAETSGIDNALCALLANKINLFNRNIWLTWTLSVELLRKAKRATYQSLTERQNAKIDQVPAFHPLNKFAVNNSKIRLSVKYF